MTKFSKITTLVLFTATALLMSACSSQAPGTKPDDMSAEEHQEAAEEHQQVADDHLDQHDPEARATREDPTANPTRAELYSTETYNPTEHHQVAGEKHQRHADQHSQAAQKLLSYEEEHCAQFPEETRSACPLMGQIKAVEDVEGGARITFHKDVPMQATVDHMKCHFAFARTEGYEGMQSCPLYLKGVSVEAKDDGQSVILTTDEPAAVEPLRERSREHVTQ